MNKENKRLYVDVSQWNAPTRYVTWNIDLTDMLIKQNLSSIEMNLFLSIAMRYDNAHESGRMPQSYSYEDLAKLAWCSKNGAIKAIKNLIDSELIICIGGKERAGRKKLQYIPNVENIHKKLKEHITSRSVPLQ